MGGGKAVGSSGQRAMIRMEAATRAKPDRHPPTCSQPSPSNLEGDYIWSREYAYDLIRREGADGAAAGACAPGGEKQEFFIRFGVSLVRIRADQLVPCLFYSRGKEQEFFIRLRLRPLTIWSGFVELTVQLCFGCSPGCSHLLSPGGHQVVLLQ